MKPDCYFAVPGDLATLTGGYAYARHLFAALEALGVAATHLQLPASFPGPDHNALTATDKLFATLPEGSVVIVDGLAFGVMDKIALRHAARLKLIALCHHPLALEAGRAPDEALLLRQSETAALGAAAAVLVTSNMTRQILIQDFAVPAEKITVAVPGTQQQVFAECSGNPPVLLTVATLTKRKAHDVLIAALANLVHLPWTARFVGGLHFDTAWVRVLQQQIENSGLADRIRFVGAIADPCEEYQRADVFVLPSLFEGYGMVFAEALAFGLPVIGARAGAVPEVVPADAGILVAPSDVDALTNAIHEVLTDAARRISLQQGARRAAALLPEWQKTARIVADVVKRVDKQ